MNNYQLSYYPDITQYRTQAEIRSAVITFSEALAKAFSKKTGETVSIEVLPVMDVKSQTKLMQQTDGKCAIGLMKPVSYVIARKNNPNILPAAVAWREIAGVEDEYYLGQLFARNSSGINSIKDIRKIHRVAYGDSFSTSNFLIPAYDLYSQGVHPFTGFRMSKFYGGHDGSAKAVYFNEADVGAGHDGAILLLGQEKGFEDAPQILKTISKVKIYSDPVVVRKDLLTNHDKLTEALVEISSEAIVKKALQDFWGNVTRLGVADASKYQAIEDAMTKLSLSEKDIL